MTARYTLGQQPGSDYAGEISWQRLTGSGPVRFGDVYAVTLTGSPDVPDGEVARLTRRGTQRWMVTIGDASTAYPFTGDLQHAAIAVATTAIENARYAARAPR